MSLTLILNASEAFVQAVLAEGTGEGTGGSARLVAAEERPAPTSGTELLPPLIDELLRREGYSPRDVGRMACVTGPGSFTGIRLVLTLAAAMRRVLDIPCAGINFLQALAASHPCAEGTLLRVLTPARRDKVHAQTFIMGADGLPLPHPQTPEPLLLPLSEGPLCAAPGAVHLGSGVEKMASAESLVCAPVLTPTPEALIRLADASSAWAKRDLDPLYVRPCDAIDNLDHIAALRGQNPAEAHAELERLLREGVPLR